MWKGFLRHSNNIRINSPYNKSISSKYNSALNNKMTSLSSIVSILNEFAPLHIAEHWDNVGLLIEPFTPREINKIMLTNDLTESVMKEVLETNTDMIISYHPPIFSALKRITQNTWKERIVSMCLENRIALYSPHTAWDSVRNGVNDYLANALPIKNSEPIKENEKIPDYGAGRYCTLEESLTLQQIIEIIKSYTQLPNLRVALAEGMTINSQVKTVAVCAGSGGSLLKGIGADLYLTGEMLHHDVLDANHIGSHVILLNHSNSERGYLPIFKDILLDLLKIPEIEIIISKNDVDPLSTY